MEKEDAIDTIEWAVRLEWIVTAVSSSQSDYAIDKGDGFKILGRGSINNSKDEPAVIFKL